MRYFLRSKKHGFTKRALTLIELLVVFFILVLMAGSMSFGFVHYSRQAALKNTKDRLERLFSQADFVATIFQQEAEVLILKQDGHWYAKLKPWGDEEDEALDVFRNLPSNFLELEGIEKFQFNDTNVTELSLVFLPMRGIDPYYIRAKDWMDSYLTARELGVDGRNRTISSMNLTFQGISQKKEVSLDLLPYARLTPHISIPEEYIDLDT